MDSLSAEQRLVLLEIIAAQHPEISRYFWLSLAEFYERNPYENPPSVLTLALQALEQSPNITFRVDENKFASGATDNLYITLSRPHPVHVGDKVITLDVGKAIDPTEVIVINGKPGDPNYFSTLDFAPIKISGDGKSATATLLALKPVFEALAEVWRFEYTASDAARRLTAISGHPSSVVPPPIVMPKRAITDGVSLTMTQIGFVKRLMTPVSFAIRGRSETKGTRKPGFAISRDQYSAFLYDLMNDAYDIVSGSLAFDAFVVDDPKLMERTLARRDLEHAKFLISRTLIRERNMQLMTLGLFRRFAVELGLRHDENTSTPFSFLAAMHERDRLVLTQRVEMHEKLMDAMTYNNCPHTRLRLRSEPGLRHVPPRVREEYFGEVVNDIILCKKCNLPFMCMHNTGDVPVNTYSRRVGRQVMCKFCGEILQERLLDDIDEERIVDEDFQRQLWGRLQNAKETLLAGAKGAVGGSNGGSGNVGDRKILSFVSRPLYDQYTTIERMRTMRFELREIYQRFYMDVYIIVTLGMMKYHMRDISGVDSIVKYLMTQNQANITSMQMDELRIKSIISSAYQALADRLNDVKDAVELNPSVVAVNNSMIFRQLLTGNLAGSDTFVNNLADPIFVALIGKRFDDYRRDQDMSFVRARINDFPAPLRPYVLWLISEGPLDNPKELVDGARHRLAAEALRPCMRRTGTTLPPKYTWQFWYPGAVDFSIEPTKTYVFRDSAGKLVDVAEADLRKRPGGMQFVDYRRADGKLLREEWWSLGYPAMYSKAIASGLGFHIHHVNPLSAEKAKELRRKMTHDLFVEAHERVCPAAKTLSLHQYMRGTPPPTPVGSSMRGTPPPTPVGSSASDKCSICHATYAEITTSLAYFEKYEAVFSTVYTREIHLEGFAGSDSHVFAYKDPHKIVADNSSSLEEAIGRVQLIVPAEPEYWRQLGNLVGRTYEETLQLSRDNACPANTSRHRYGVIVGHIRNVYQMLGYIVNLDSHGAEYKHPQLYDMARKKPATPVVKKYHSDLGAIVQKLAGEPAFDEASGQPFIDGVIAILCNAIADIHRAHPELGVFAATNLLASDKNTAVLTKLDFINAPVSISDDYQNDADFQALDLRSRHEDDPLFQDFDFEGGDDNVAPRD